jgi:hypothetical protein
MSPGVWSQLGVGESATHHGAFAPPPLAIDAIVDALEERVLAEIDRRGGRYQGIF